MKADDRVIGTTDTAGLVRVFICVEIATKLCLLVFTSIVGMK